MARIQSEEHTVARFFCELHTEGPSRVIVHIGRTGSISGPCVVATGWYERVDSQLHRQRGHNRLSKG